MANKGFSAWNASTIVTIVQESIRYVSPKKFAVYFDGSYFGTYWLVEKEVFKVKDLTNTTSILYFGKKKKQGIEELKKFKIKGRISDNTEMALISLQWHEYEGRYDLY